MTTRIVDNSRLKLSEVLLAEAPNFKKASIATGYWDLPGFQLLQDAFQHFEQIRLIIGQEPLPPMYVKSGNLNEIDDTFPEAQIGASLAQVEQRAEMRASAKLLKEWMVSGKLEVKILRGQFLHAKAYIFGDFNDNKALGTIGSSNFTAAGLTKNLELNAVEDDMTRVYFKPQTNQQPHGHLTWFNELWENEKAELWNGKFTELIDASPLGDMTFSEYHMYIKALYEIYGDELVSDISTDQAVEDILYDFQIRNSRALLHKLSLNGVAILADSVGLGKTITAGAILKNYIDEQDASRVYVIAPASLVQQWRDELRDVFKLVLGFEVISLQDAVKIKQAREIDKYAPVDLFVVDEAHNLRSGSGSRYDELLDWFSDNPESHVLLLTATPINNSLKDIKNQIQLGAKGKLHSYPVVYPTQNKIEVIDFYDAIERLNADIKRDLRAGKEPNYAKVNDVMRQGLRHFMVRTTRAGIEKEFGGVKTKDGTLLKFPKAENKPAPYSFNPAILGSLISLINTHQDVFDNIPVSSVSIQWLLDLTQRTQHPLDAIAKAKDIVTSTPATPFESIFQILLLLGFAPYKADVYRDKYYGHDVETIKAYLTNKEEKARVASQLSIHNMLRVTYLKRLESSQYALQVSLQNYEKRLQSFETLLNQGKIARVKDMAALLDLIGDDNDGEVDIDWDSADIEVIDADPKVFNISALKTDIHRDKLIIKILLEMCAVLAANDDKLKEFADLLNLLDDKAKYGAKVLVFSYYADTVAYLEKHLPEHVTIKNFASKAAYISGSSRSKINELASRFSPISKKAKPEIKALGELDYLFATDVLSEGQNLQDCAVIVNFDLHWNPVRMIQRNGRINRLGSKFHTVHIFNMHPDKNLNAYLSLVERLQQKINQIKYSIGTDQSILGEAANPLEFVDIYDPAKANGAIDDLDDDKELLTEDEFIQDLREFDATASVSEKMLVNSIGAGKWGYLPSGFTQHIGAVNSLSLVSAKGVYEHTKQNYKNLLFVKKKDSTFEAVETFKALAAIRVPKSVNQKRVDNINLDREDIAKKTRLVARNYAKKGHTYYRITRKVVEALDAVKKARPEFKLDEALERVYTRQAAKRARKLIVLINVNMKEFGVLKPEILQEVESFVTWMAQYKTPNVNLDDNSLKGVLHFAA